MSPTRIAITLDRNGHIEAICADELVEVFIVDPNVPHDRVYKMGNVEIGPHFLRYAVGCHPIGHAQDGALSTDGPVSPRLPPMKPRLRLVE